MASICFVGPYKPIMCGIADYTSFLARRLPLGKWAALSFDPERHGAPLTGDVAPPNQVWYGIPGRTEFSASTLRDGLRELGLGHNETVLWVQHEFGLWPNHQKLWPMPR